MKIGFLGMGVMGLPMAKNVVKKSGCQVLGYDVAQKQLDSFAAAGGSAKTTVRTIDLADVRREEDMVTLRVHGNAFLYNMVRIMVGTLVEIGLHRRGEDAFDQAFRTLDRLCLGVTAPPHGLELTQVYYPDEAFLSPEVIRWHKEPLEHD